MNEFRHGGMSSYVPQGPLEWVSLNLMSEYGVLEAIHRYPLDGFVHYLDRDGTCVCGPSATIVEGFRGSHVAMFKHSVFGVDDGSGGDWIYDVISDWLDSDAEED